MLKGEDRKYLIERIQAILSPDDLIELQNQLDSIHTSDALIDYIQDLLEYSRTSGDYIQGLSPRAGLALLNAAKAWLENSNEFSNQSILIKKIDTLNKSDLTPSLPNISEPTEILTKYMDSFKDKQ